MSSVKELVVVPKQKFETLSSLMDGEKKEMKDSACQTEIQEQLESSQQIKTVKDNNKDYFVQRVQDGIPGELNVSRQQQQRRRQHRRTKINWIPY